MNTSSTKRPGPRPDRLKVDKDWEEAVADALKKKRPDGGWPEPKDREPDDQADGGGSE